MEVIYNSVIFGLKAEHEDLAYTYLTGGVCYAEMFGYYSDFATRLKDKYKLDKKAELKNHRGIFLYRLYDEKQQRIANKYHKELVWPMLKDFHQQINVEPLTEDLWKYYQEQNPFIVGKDPKKYGRYDKGFPWLKVEIDAEKITASQMFVLCQQWRLMQEFPNLAYMTLKLSKVLPGYPPEVYFPMAANLAGIDNGHKLFGSGEIKIDWEEALNKGWSFTQCMEKLHKERPKPYIEDGRKISDTSGQFSLGKGRNFKLKVEEKEKWLAVQRLCVEYKEEYEPD